MQILTGRAKQFISLITISVSILLTAPSVQATQLDKDKKAKIDDITQYLKAIQSLQGEFSQIGPRGRVSTGVFFIQKPGRMRFEYAPPNPFLIVSDGTWVTVKNREKRRRPDQYPLSSTPLRLLLENRIDLTKETKITAVESTSEIVRVTLVDKSSFSSGSLQLVFDRKSRSLNQWIVIDQRNRKTTVSLSNLKYGIKADPKLFFVDVRKQEPKFQRKQNFN